MRLAQLLLATAIPLLPAHLCAQSAVIALRELTDADVAAIDLHDGFVTDWLEVVGEPTVSARDFIGSAQDPFSIDFRVWLAWHAATDRIYVAVEWIDDHYVTNWEHPGNLYRGRSRFGLRGDGSVMFGVDGDLSGGGLSNASVPHQTQFATQAEYLLAVNQEEQIYFAFASPPDDGPRVAMWNMPDWETDWPFHPPYSDGGGGRFSEAPTVTVLEFYVTAFDSFVWNDASASIVSDLHPDKRIRVNVMVYDTDSPTDGSAMGSLFWLPGNDALLLGRQSAIVPETVDLSDATWGRVKQAAPISLDSTSTP